MGGKKKKTPQQTTAPPTPSVSTITQMPFPRMEPPHMYMMSPCPYYPIPFPTIPRVIYPTAYQPTTPPFQFAYPMPYYGMMPMSQAMSTVRQLHLQPALTYPGPNPFYDRRNQTPGEAAASEVLERDRLVGLREPISLSSLLRGSRKFRKYPIEVTTDNFGRFLEHGCIIGEQIAINNRHRPCFKNIESLCDRTRGEIIRPTNISANVQAQGLHWAAKDFIYAYVRLINSWHMLKNYVDSTPGSLGWMEYELTPEFRNTFEYWERDSKELASHLIRVFTTLSESVVITNTSTSLPVIHVQKDEPSNIPPLEIVDLPSTSPLPNIDQLLASRTDDNICPVVDGPVKCIEERPKEECELPPLQPVEIPPLPNFDQPSTSKTGTIKKQLKKQATEEKPKSQESGSLSSEELWPDNQLPGFQSTLSYLMSTFTQSETSDENDLKGAQSLFPWNMYWPGPSGQPILADPVGILRPNTYGGLELVDNAAQSTTTTTPGDKTNAPAEMLWENETSGLTSSAIIVLQSIVDVMNKNSFTKWLEYSKSLDMIEFPTQLDTIRQKVTDGDYHYVNQFVFDMKRIISNATLYCMLTSNKDGIDQLAYYDAYFNNMISREFPDFDFSHIGDDFTNLGALVRKKK